MKSAPRNNEPVHSGDSRKLGIGMFVLAWGVLILLLVLFFNHWLKEQQNPNRQPHSSKSAMGQIEVTLKANKQHHYVVNGTINGHNVVFLLDTGATDVVIPSVIAQAIGLRSGRKNYANTANGAVAVYATVLDNVQVGDIKLSNITASINPGMQMNAVLLGMSALRKIEFTQRGDTLTLRQ